MWNLWMPIEVTIGWISLLEKYDGRSKKYREVTDIEVVEGQPVD